MLFGAKTCPKIHFTLSSWLNYSRIPTLESEELDLTSILKNHSRRVLLARAYKHEH
jgi:hypothetical protein